MKKLYILTLIFTIFVLFAYTNPQSVFAYAKCGKYHGESFPYYTDKWQDPERGSGYLYEEMTEWPTTDKKDFCDIGEPKPNIPPFPEAGEDTTWNCVGDYRTVSCFAHRSPYPDFVAPGEASTCLNIAGYCGNLHGRIFKYNQTSWPEDGYACAHTIEDSSAQNLLFYPDGPVLPFNWGSRLRPTDLEGRGGYRDEYTSHSNWRREVLNNPPYNFHTQPSDFPEPGGRVEWRCTRTWGFWTYGLNIHPREYYINCWAERRMAPEPPECGDLDESKGGNLSCGLDLDEERWSAYDGLLCESGLVQVNSKFPEPGGSAEWNCVSSDGSDSVSCSVRRDPSPICGTRARTYEYEEKNWREDQSWCLTGELQGSEPDFPEPGPSGEVEWFCENSDCLVDTPCKAVRNWPPTWISSRGGLFHAEGDIGMHIRDLLYSQISGLNFSKEERLSLSTELVTTRKSLDLTGENPYIYLYKLENYNKRLRHDWYETLLDRAKARDPGQNNWGYGGNNIDFDKCKDGQYVYFIPGDLNINPKDYSELAKEGFNGCIFVVGNEINILAGGRSTPFNYETIRGYFVSNGDINILNNSSGESDGLKVVGGFFTGMRTINLERRLASEDNALYPVMAMFHDARYLNIAANILGETLESQYIRDIGFKE